MNQKNCANARKKDSGLCIIDHAVEPTKNAIIVARQLITALQKLQNAFYDSKKAADSDEAVRRIDVM